LAKRTEVKFKNQSMRTAGWEGTVGEKEDLNLNL